MTPKTWEDEMGAWVNSCKGLNPSSTLGSEVDARYKSTSFNNS